MKQRISLRGWTPKLPTLGQIKDGLTSAVVALSTGMIGIGIYKASFSESIGFEPLLVPSGFTERGYSQSITTNRLVDEIKKINDVATTTKARSSVSGNAPGEELARISSLPLPAGIDLNAIQGLIRELLGITLKSLSGDITIAGKPDEGRYHVRVRLAPSNQLVVDGVFEGEPDAILKAAALKIVETVDPVVAASYFRNNKRIDEALRCVDLALTNDKAEDDTFALSQRAQIYLGQKKYALAKADLDELLRIDPNSPQGLGVQSYWYNDQKMFKEGLVYAEKQMKAKPDLWHSYFNKADALMGMGLDAEAEMRQGIQYKPNKGWAYVDTAEYIAKKGKTDEALRILKLGVNRLPNATDLSLAYGEMLLSAGHQELSLHYLRKVYASEPDNRKVWPLLLTALPASGNDELKAELKAKIGGGTNKPV